MDRARVLGHPLTALAALLAGLALGTLAPQAFAWLAPGVRGAFALLADAAPFIIFLTLVPGLLALLRAGGAGRMALATLAAFVGMKLAASLVAVAVLALLFALPFSAQGGDAGAALAAAAGATLRLATTSRLFLALWYALLVAAFLHFGARRAALRWFCAPTARVLVRVGAEGMAWVGRGIRVVFPALLFALGAFVPLQVGEAAGAAGGAEALRWYALGTAALVLILGLYLAAAVPLAARAGRVPLRRFLRDYAAFVFPFAWATSSSAATIPLSLERLQALGVRREVREFVVPLGATLNLQGSLVNAFVLAVAAGLLVGGQPTVLDLLLLVVPLTLVSFGIPGVPGGVLVVAPPVVAAVLPLPLGSEAAFFALFVALGVGLPDQFRTGANAVVNGLVCLLVARAAPAAQAPPAPAPTGSSTAAP